MNRKTKICNKQKPQIKLSDIILHHPNHKGSWINSPSPYLLCTNTKWQHISFTCGVLVTALCHAWNHVKLWCSHLKFWLMAPCCRRTYTFYFHSEWFENDAVVIFITSHMFIRWWSAIMFMHYSTASFIAHFFIFKPPRHSFHL